MKEFVEKLIGRLEELQKLNYEAYEVVRHIPDKIGYINTSNAYANAISIVKELAEEYKSKDCSQCSRRKFYQQGYEEARKNNGWIPCSERLPEESLNSVLGWDEYRSRCCFVHYVSGRWVIGNDIDSVKIIAWQPLPQPYKEGE